MNTRFEVGFPGDSVENRFNKYLDNLDAKTLQQIKVKVDALADVPRPPGKSFRVLHPPVAVYGYVAQYRLRIGNHRILYDVDDANKRVVLLAIRRRSESTYE